MCAHIHSSRHTTPRHILTPALTTLMAPAEADPLPDNTSTLPPELLAEEDAPPVMVRLPATPLFVLPTDSTMAPPGPARGCPVATMTGPVAPVLVVPLLNSRAPEAPAVPALALTTRTKALVVAVEAPDASTTEPPVTLLAPVAAPANKVSGPPLDAPLPANICKQHDSPHHRQESTMSLDDNDIESCAGEKLTSRCMDRGTMQHKLQNMSSSAHI